MFSVEITASWSAIGLAALSSAAIVLTVITYTRLAGLRSFSKMSSFDFAVTIAVGSTMGAVGLSGSSLVVGMTVLGTFYLVQVVIALLRRNTGLDALVDNDALLLMVGGNVLTENLATVRVTEDDIRSKLREANVYRYDDLKAVVLESTGDISVIHGDGELDVDIFSDVRDRAALTR